MRKITDTMAILRKVVYVLFVIAVVFGTNANATSEHENDIETDPEMEKYLREAMENFREQMKVGIPAINMPVLDPLELRNLDVNVHENLATLTLHIKEITVRDLATFHLQNIKADLEKFFLNLKLSIPSVRATGKYHLNGKVLKIFPLTGNGGLSLNLTNAVISGVGRLAFADGTLQMDNLDLDLSWNNIQIFLENFLGGGKFSTMLQKLLPNVGKSIYERFKPQLLGNLATSLKRTVNKMLQKPEVRAIITGIIPS